uniref:Exostosin GT47 domain-containing protein n=1 Tax=Ananas comosus var. bracteatus TaxID=296719 RepID=A0A6V7QLN4_ANACO|nr:unnamed protein product [Ananas comosus var. bracteatus]
MGRPEWGVRDGGWGPGEGPLPGGRAYHVGCPTPTYFHPAKDADVFSWQDRMRKLDRRWPFSFAGAPRPRNPESIRGQIIDQRKAPGVCKLLESDLGESACRSPSSSIMHMFQSSLFYLQPHGDSYTIRGDQLLTRSMLAGCRMTFEREMLAQRRRFRKISLLVVAEMREEVVSLIPRLIYADPRAVRTRVSLRRDSWKYTLLAAGQRTVGPHEWDPFFPFRSLKMVAENRAVGLKR